MVVFLDNHLSSLICFLIKDMNVIAFWRRCSDIILVKFMRKRENMYFVNIFNVVNTINTSSNSTNRNKVLIYCTNKSLISTRMITTNKFWKHTKVNTQTKQQARETNRVALQTTKRRVTMEVMKMRLIRYLRKERQQKKAKMDIVKTKT